MENASKALLIAGAILLVIAIIAIGVGIVSQTRGTIDVAGNQISSMEIQMHNEQLKQYEGKGKSHNDIKSMLAEITAYNSGVKNSSLKVKIRTYEYTNTANTTISSMHCEVEPNAIYSSYTCSLYTPATKNFLYDVFCEYSSTGAVKYVKLVKYKN